MHEILSIAFVKKEKDRLLDLIETSYYMVEDQRTTNYVIKIQVANYKEKKEVDDSDISHSYGNNDPDILYENYDNGVCYRKSELLMDRKFRKDIINYYRRISRKIFVKFFTGEHKKTWMIMLCWN